MDIYEAQRSALLLRHPGLAVLLPPQPPVAPPVAAMRQGELRRVLGESASNQSATVIIVGFGDGTVLRTIASDAHLRGKAIHQLVLLGEEACFAAAFSSPLLESLNGVKLRVTHLGKPEDIAAWAVSEFGGHADIPVLAGADYLEDHPLCQAGDETRRAWLPVIQKALSDRPTAYGNDVVDSFTGLQQAARNARVLLPAPTIGQMRGFFGNTPCIAIAAGPSLKRRLDDLRALQDRCILVACDAVLSGLLAEGIDPHFVTPLERIDATRRMMEGGRHSRAIYAGLPVVVPEVVENFVGRAIGLYCGDKLYDWLCPNPGPRVNSGMSTGVLSVTVASALTNGPVYLVGHDLARDAAGSHWGGADYAAGAWAAMKKKVETKASALSGYDTRMIPGNDGGLVESIAWWDRFREEISHEGRLMASRGRELRNPNMVDRIYAKIDHTVAAPLPNPADLPILPPIVLPASDPSRLTDWQERARHLPNDCEVFTVHLAKLRDEIRQQRGQPPHTWDVESLAEKLDFEVAGISPGNRMAFSYFLRSALHNTNATMHLQRRVSNLAHSRWKMFDAIDQAAEAMINSLARLRPDLEEIVREHC